MKKKKGKKVHGESQNFLEFNNCSEMTIKGHGVIDGLGYDWWIREWSQKNIAKRPKLLTFNQLKNADISGIELRNSPSFNMILKDIDSVYIHDLEIKTDIMR